jgi:hypothetical protein
LLIDLKDLRRELEIESHLHRSTLPGEPAASEHVSGRAADGEGQRGATAAQTDAAARTTSSAEYLVTEIKRHKLGVGMVLAILLAAAVSAYFYFALSGAAPIDSIAVLPLVNASHNPDTEYLSDSESLINSLTELRS